MYPVICGTMQGLLIKKNAARGAKKQAAARLALRRHVETCDFCRKNYLRLKRHRKIVL